MANMIKKGMTLLELLIVLAIAGILGAVVFSSCGMYNNDYEFRGYLPGGGKVYVDKRTGQEMVVGG